MSSLSEEEIQKIESQLNLKFDSKNDYKNPQGDLKNKDKAELILLETKERYNIGNIYLKADQILDLNVKEYLMLFGTTGVGKTAIFNILQNGYAKAIKARGTQTTWEFGKFQIPADTTLPRKGFMKEIDLYNSNSSFKIVIFDNPGFFDTRGFSIDISNYYFITKLFNLTSSLKFAYIIKASEFCRENLLKKIPDLLEFLSNIEEVKSLFGSKITPEKYIVLIINEVDEDTQIDGILEMIEHSISDLDLVNHSCKEQVKSFLQFFKKNHNQIMWVPKAQTRDIGREVDLMDVVKRAHHSISHTNSLKKEQFPKAPPFITSNENKKIIIQLYVFALKQVIEKSKNFSELITKSCINMLNIDPKKLIKLKLSDQKINPEKRMLDYANDADRIFNFKENKELDSSLEKLEDLKNAFFLCSFSEDLKFNTDKQPLDSNKFNIINNFLDKSDKDIQDEINIVLKQSKDDLLKTIKIQLIEKIIKKLVQDFNENNELDKKIINYSEKKNIYDTLKREINDCLFIDKLKNINNLPSIKTILGDSIDISSEKEKIIRFVDFIQIADVSNERLLHFPTNDNFPALIKTINVALNDKLVAIFREEEEVIYSLNEAKVKTFETFFKDNVARLVLSIVKDTEIFIDYFPKNMSTMKFLDLLDYINKYNDIKQNEIIRSITHSSKEISKVFTKYEFKKEHEIFIDCFKKYFINEASKNFVFSNLISGFDFFASFQKDKDGEIVMLKDQNSEYSIINENLSNENIRMKNLIANYEIQLQNYNYQITNLKNDNNFMNVELNKIKENNTQLKNELNIANNKISVLNINVESMKNDISNKNSKIDYLEEIGQKKDIEINKCKKILEIHQNYLERLKNSNYYKRKIKGKDSNINFTIPDNGIDDEEDLNNLLSDLGQVFPKKEDDNSCVIF